MKQDEFCAICEKKLTRKDSNHVCRRCFGQAREKKVVEVQVSDQAANTIGTAIVLGEIFNWGLSKLAEMAPPMPVPADPGAPGAREKLREIQKRLKLPGGPGLKRRRRPGRGL